MWTFSSRPTARNVATSDDPPSERNGSGIPVMGMMPTVMPMLTKAWRASMATTPGGQEGAAQVALPPTPPEPIAIRPTSSCR